MAGKLKEKEEAVVPTEVVEAAPVQKEAEEVAPKVINEAPKAAAQVGHATRAFRQ